MRRTACAALLLSVCQLTSACAATYVIDPRGNDSKSGDAEEPWRTLQHAAEQVTPGDRVVVSRGAYSGFYLTSSGTAAAPIEFIAEPGVMVSSPNLKTPDGINLEGASHVVIDGFEVIGMQRAGVRAVGPSMKSKQEFAQSVTIRNVVVRNNQAWGIFTGFVHDVLIEGCTAEDSVSQHGIYVSNSGDRPVIRGNKASGNYACGIQLNADRHMGLDGVIEKALISGNILFDNGLRGGSAINLDGVRDSRIENNLLYNNHASGISLYQIDGGAPSTGNTVVNNTVLQAKDGWWALNLQNGSTGATLANNILLNDHPSHGAIDVSSDSLKGLKSNNNAVISRFTVNAGNSLLSLKEWRKFTSQDSDSFVATAAELFGEVESGDHQLKPGSPAQDGGWRKPAPKSDLRGVSRPQGAGIDIGAYERSPKPVDSD